MPDQTTSSPEPQESALAEQQQQAPEAPSKDTGIGTFDSFLESINKQIAEKQQTPESDQKQEEQAEEPVKKEVQKPASDESKPPSGPGSHRRWDELKKKEKLLEKLEKDHELSNKELADLRKWREDQQKIQSVSREEFEKLSKERDHLANELRIVDVTRDPKFKSETLDPINNIMTEALQEVPQELRREVQSAITANTRPEIAKALHALSDKLEPWLNEALRGYAQDLYPHMQRYKQTIRDAQAEAARREAVRLSEIEQGAANREKVFKDQLAAALAEESFAPILKGTDEPTKKAAEERILKIREFANSMGDPENAARAAIWSSIGPELKRANEQLQQRIKELESKQDKVRKLADPTPQGTGQPSAEEEQDLDMSYSAMLRRIAAGSR